MIQPDSQMPTQVGHELERATSAAADSARETLAEVNHRLLEFARERPVLTVVAALSAGFILGKLVSRI